MVHAKSWNLFVGIDDEGSSWRGHRRWRFGLLCSTATISARALARIQTASFAGSFAFCIATVANMSRYDIIAARANLGEGAEQARRRQRKRVSRASALQSRPRSASHTFTRDSTLPHPVATNVDVFLSPSLPVCQSTGSFCAASLSFSLSLALSGGVEGTATDEAGVSDAPAAPPFAAAAAAAPSASSPCGDGTFQ